MYCYPPGRNMPEGPIPGVAGGMLSVPYDMGGMPMRDAGGQAMPVPALATALANASPEQQRTVCCLFVPLFWSYVMMEYSKTSIHPTIACFNDIVFISS